MIEWGNQLSPGGRRVGARAVSSLLLVGFALSGCQTNKAKTSGQVTKTGHTFASPSDTSTALISNTDPSAMNLQDMSGAILMYYALNKRLPENLEQAAPLADAPVSLTVPGTDKKYLYTPNGFLLQDRESRIVVFEPAPMHNGFRLAITMADPQPNVAPVCKVIALPESLFLLRPPDSTTEAPAQTEVPPHVPPPPPAGVGRPRGGFGNHR